MHIGMRPLIVQDLISTRVDTPRPRQLAGIYFGVHGRYRAHSALVLATRRESMHKLDIAH